MKLRVPAAWIGAIALVASLITFTPTQSAEAADAAQFDPGNLISDANFFNGSAMTAGEVQSFIAGKLPSCRSGYTCLPSYTQNTPSMPALAGRCAAYTGAGGESASAIIAKVGAACGISQKVLLVLLQKEQSLVTDTWPSAGQYASATGYSCPDTAACDPAYAGFFFQVYHAARQFKSYAANPGNWNHQAGRVNYIRYDTELSCGSSPVYIANQATAGLYNYTPYQPNAAALANLYGTGDSCSAYGNRNFWRIYSDWFGSPNSDTSLVKTSASSTVYLVSGGAKYGVPSLEVLSALAPLGAVGIVSQGYLDGFTTKHDVGRTLRGPDGSIYFFDAGIKLGITSCQQAVDYGASCAEDGYVQLTEGQISAFRTGPNLLPVLGTTAGNRYYIKDGQKREILDDQSQALAGIPAGFNVLTEGAVSALPLGAPITRDSVFFNERGTNNFSFLTGSKRYGVPGQASSFGIPARNAGVLSWPSIALIPNSGILFEGTVAVPGKPEVHFLSAAGRQTWPAGVGGWTNGAALPMSEALVNTYTSLGSISVGALVKSASNATVYVVMPTELKPIGSWAALMAMSPGGTPNILTVSESVIAALPKGIVALTAGSLVRSPGDATIWLINGTMNRIPVSSFIMTNAAGITAWETFPQDRIDAYPIAPSVLGFGFVCDGRKYVSGSGSIHLVPAEQESLYPITYLELDRFTCNQLPVGAPATKFLRDADSNTIYLLDGGMKRPIGSMWLFNHLGGDSIGYLNVPWHFVTLIPTGPDA
ncbi:hypothetical protein [Agromyces sp. Root81]|uniref:hypothetical protein n=1 Tax=Agromyces sp. Root81 TaxID=1736601 RepID=UPI000AB6FF92|nr:hypothetical protein [Agromyces sp. Root81]